MFLSSFDISGYGLSAQRVRVNTISSNIANANTTRTDEGGPYRRREVVFRAFDFDKVLNEKLGKNNQQLKYEDPLREGDLGKEPKPAIMSVYVHKIAQKKCCRHHLHLRHEGRFPLPSDTVIHISFFTFQ